MEKIKVRSITYIKGRPVAAERTQPNVASFSASVSRKWAK